VIRPHTQPRNVRHDQPYETNNSAYCNGHADDSGGDGKHPCSKSIYVQTEGTRTFFTSEQDIEVRGLRQAQNYPDRQDAGRKQKILPFGRPKTA
jgi:hypothetical protein